MASNQSHHRQSLWFVWLSWSVSLLSLYLTNSELCAWILWAKNWTKQKKRKEMSVRLPFPIRIPPLNFFSHLSPDLHNLCQRWTEALTSSNAAGVFLSHKHWAIGQYSQTNLLAYFTAPWVVATPGRSIGRVTRSHTG